MLLLPPIGRVLSARQIMLKPDIDLVGTFIVGAYPALVLSSYKPVMVLKGKLFQSAEGILLRKGLVSFQFVLSLLLIAGTLTVYWQL